MQCGPWLCTPWGLTCVDFMALSSVEVERWNIASGRSRQLYTALNRTVSVCGIHVVRFGATYGLRRRPVQGHQNIYHRARGYEEGESCLYTVYMLS